MKGFPPFPSLLLLLLLPSPPTVPTPQEVSKKNVDKAKNKRVFLY